LARNWPLYLRTDFAPAFFLCLIGGIQMIWGLFFPCVHSRKNATIFQYFNLTTAFFAAAVLDYFSHQLGSFIFNNRNAQFIYWSGFSCVPTMNSVITNIYSATGLAAQANVGNVLCPDVVLTVIGTAIYLGAGAVVALATWYYQQRDREAVSNGHLLYGSLVLWAGWIVFIVGYGDFFRRNQNEIRPPATRRLYRNSIYPEFSTFIPVGAVLAILSSLAYRHPYNTQLLYLTNLAQYAAVGNIGAYLMHTANILDTGFRTEFNPLNFYSQTQPYPPLVSGGSVYKSFSNFPACTFFDEECQRIRLIMAGACISLIGIFFLLEVGLAQSVSRVASTAPSKGQTFYTGDDWQAGFVDPALEHEPVY